jgi:hypothetical protein
LSKISFKSANAPTRKNAGGRVFSCLGDLLAYQARTATDRIAILGPEPWSITYGALWASSNYTVHRLRSVGVSRTDRHQVRAEGGRSSLPSHAIGSLPANMPTRCFRQIINSGLAIGHEIPAGLVLRADEVIE